MRRLIPNCQLCLPFSLSHLSIPLGFGSRLRDEDEPVTHDDLGNSSQLGRLFVLGPNDPVLGVGCSSATAHCDHDGHTSNENFGLRVRGHIKYMYMYKE
jgi:hypothetical protein